MGKAINNTTRNMPNTTSAEGINMIIQLEGSRPTVYDDAAGLPTVGVGHLLTRSELSSGKIQLENGKELSIRQPLSFSDIHTLLAEDLGQAEWDVRNSVTVELNQAQFDALVSFAFNIGGTALRKSTLLKQLNDGNYTAVPEQMRRWNKAGGRVLRGLIKRRETEIALWCGQAVPVFQPEPEPPTLTELPADERQFAAQGMAVQGEIGRVISYQRVSSSPAVALLNRLIPPGYGTYVVVAVWLGVNAATAMGYAVPGFMVASGNEGALSVAGLALAYLRRAMNNKP